MFNNGEHSFVSGQLVRRIRNHGEAVDTTHFTALIPAADLLDARGGMHWVGKIEVSYDCIGTCVKLLKTKFDNGIMLVLFGDILCVQNMSSMEPYEDD